MSCKNDKCCSSRPVEPLMGLPDWVVAELMLAATAGIARAVPWPNETLRALAEKVASLAAENSRLQALLKREQPSIVKDGTATIAFGPNDQYSLQIPVSSPADRSRLAKSFLLAAAELQKLAPQMQPPPEQLDLPFAE